MTQLALTHVVQRYAKEWGLCIPEPVRIESERKWFCVIAQRLWYETEQWDGFAYVKRGDSKPAIFDFRPKQEGLLMLPLWAAYPSYSAAAIGWRMGSGEDYRYAWWDWYSKLSAEQRESYQRNFPVPANDRDWNLWHYDFTR